MVTPSSQGRRKPAKRAVAVAAAVDEQDAADESEADEPQPPSSEVACFAIDGSACRVVRVDGMVPQHHICKTGSRAQLKYLANEIVHFEWQGRRYAVLMESPAAAAASSSTHEEHNKPSSDVRKLLTNRELQIVQLICMGCLTKQVADRLRISEFTVRSYLKTTYAKLGVRSRGALVFRYAQAFKGV